MTIWKQQQIAEKREIKEIAIIAVILVVAVSYIMGHFLSWIL